MLEPRIEVLGENPPEEKNRLVAIARFVRDRLASGAEAPAAHDDDAPAATTTWEDGSIIDGEALDDVEA